MGNNLLGRNGQGTMERSLQDAGNSKQGSYLTKTQIQTKWLCMFTKNAAVYDNSKPPPPPTVSGQTQPVVEVA